ncbi:MAG TPA: cytochrome P460 family protein [Terriglobus sp.]
MTRTRILSLIVGVGLLLFAVAQLIRPTIPNPPVTAEIQAPPEVKAILQQRCYQCHSNEVKLPVLDQVAPAYWLAAHDVREARQHLNFSEIGKLPKAQQNATLFEAINMIQLGAMPLPRYLLAHRGAGVTPEELQTLRRYATSLAVPLPKADANAALTQQAQVAPPTQVKPSLNGIEIPRDYKNWKPISSTDRWDNGTLRQILGNDVALKAIAEGHVNPWPDGTKFAKVAWKVAPDGAGGLKAGDFFQVEFMLKDSVAYKDTDGWGWARWRGADLKPYGKDAHLANECIGCHLPAKDRDYVYTFPLKGQQ